MMLSIEKFVIKMSGGASCMSQRLRISADPEASTLGMTKRASRSTLPVASEASSRWTAIHSRSARRSWSRRAWRLYGFSSFLPATGVRPVYWPK